MIEFGKTLRSAREAKGISIAQIAETTHMMSAAIEALEAEDFSRIVAPIYGRGFVKLYCETIGIDPNPMIEAFMDIYAGRTEPIIRTRETSVIVEPTISEKPLPETPQAIGGEARPRASWIWLLSPHEYGRIAVVTVVLLLFLMLVLFGLRALYRATTKPPTEITPEEQIEERSPETPPAAPGKPATLRAPIEVPPLYMD